MTATVTLHIGINETGAANIQQWLFANREEIRRRGVLYPACGARASNHDPLCMAVTPREIKGVAHPDVDVSRLLALRDELRLEISTSKAPHVVISSESFAWLTDLQPLQDLLRTLKVRVIIYLRRHDYWLEAVYQRAICEYSRASATVPPLAHEPGFFTFLQNLRENNPEYGDYQMLVDRWATAFGKENVLVRPYNETGDGRIVVTDFLLTAGLADLLSGLEIAAPAAQPKLSRRQLQLLDVFVRVKATPALRKRLLSYAATAGGDEAEASQWPPTRRRAMLKKKAASYEYVAREFMDRDDGNLFEEELPGADDDWQPPSELTVVDYIEEALLAIGMDDTALTRPPGLLSRLLTGD